MSSEQARARSDELERALTTLLLWARQEIGARYAALGVLDAARTELDHFVTVGLDGDTLEAIGHNPRGRGVLGRLILDARPLRSADITRDPRHYGFPPDHPYMRSFLGVPILIGAEACGNLYVADERADRFTDGDEGALVALAVTAATIIQGSRLEAADGASADGRRGTEPG